MTTQPLASLVSDSPEATALVARRLVPHLAAGDTVCLQGPLGAGKSHFAREVIRALTGETDIPSPTYTLVQTYQGPTCDVWHTDLYRLGDPGEVAELGLWEAFENAIVLVEWPERLVPPPVGALWLELAIADDAESRRITASGGQRFAKPVRYAFDAAAANA